MRIKIKHKPHKKARFIIRLFGLPTKLFPKGFIGWADDKIMKMGVHAATHIDAPWHYSPTCGGEPAKTIDQMPLELGYADGIVINMEHKPDFEEITVKDLEGFLEKEQLEIKEGMIVLVRTGRDKYNGTKDFHKKGTGMGAAATEWLLDKGVKVMGIDSWGWDLPLPYQIQKAKETNDPDFFWNGHLVGKNREYWHMEQLVNLDKLPYSGFKVAVFPLPIVGASAAPARVVAILG